jgi:hypothetical protein
MHGGDTRRDTRQSTHRRHACAAGIKLNRSAAEHSSHRLRVRVPARARLSDAAAGDTHGGRHARRMHDSHPARAACSIRSIRCKPRAVCAAGTKASRSRGVRRLLPASGPRHPCASPFLMAEPARDAVRQLPNMLRGMSTHNGRICRVTPITLSPDRAVSPKGTSN